VASMDHRGRVGVMALGLAVSLAAQPAVSGKISEAILFGLFTT
jgi:hypothetical protein